MKLKTRYNLIQRGLYLLLLLALPLFSLGDDNSALFEKGNQAYAKAQYQQAIQAYRQMLGGGNQSAVVYFNLGDAYYKLGDIPSALLYYEKAHKLSPGDEDINFNIRLANLKTTDKIEAAPDFFITRWWHGFIMAFAVGKLAVLSILFCVGGFMLLVLYLFANSVLLKRSSFYTGFVVIFLGLIFIFMANRQVNYFDNHHEAIIFSGSVTVKSSPDASAKPLFVVHEGTKVAIKHKNDSWIEVELPNGNAGWIAASDAKDI
jgi:tetratricopeptide (TPR) repeat protein